MYDPTLGRWIQQDPMGYVDGANLYGYGKANPSKHLDPSGLAAGRGIGWVVRRVGTRLVRTRVFYTHKQAAALFQRGQELLVKDGMDSAMKIGRIITGGSTDDIVRGGNHAAGHWLARFGQRGHPHIQIDDIPNRHIFYGVLGGVLAAAGTEANASCEYDLDVASVYSNPRPGPSVLNVGTVSYWAGENSWWSMLDWVNPLELAALAGDAARWVDRELEKELLGVTLTLSEKGGSPIVSFSFDTNGTLVSVGRWSGGDLGPPVGGAEYLKSLDSGRFDDPVLNSLRDWMGQANQGK